MGCGMLKLCLSFTVIIRFILVCALLPFSYAQSAEKPLPKGIDISHHNGAVDWPVLKKNGTAFVFIKATDGLDYLDPMFNSHFAAAKEAGVIRGAYHFYESNDDGLAQAEWFIKNVPLLPGDLPPVVDIERVKTPVPSDIHANFNTFVNRLEEYYGHRPIIYTGERFWEHVMREHLPGYKLWIAHYGVPRPTVPPEWSGWNFWQFTEECMVEGVEKKVDCSYFNGSENELLRLLMERKSS